LAFCARSISAPSAIAFCILCKGTKIAMAVSVARQSFIVAHEIPPSKLVFWNVHNFTVATCTGKILITLGQNEVEGLISSPRMMSSLEIRRHVLKLYVVNES